MLSLKSTRSKVIFSVIAILIINFIWAHTPALDVPGGAVARSLAKNLVRAAVIVGFLLVVLKPRDILPFLGFGRNFFQGFGVALLCVLPIYAAFLVCGQIDPKVTLPLLAVKSFFPGFFEELICRAFMFGLLYRYARLPFAWAVVLPAVLFGMGHTYQGHDWLSAAAAFGVTFAGALYFSWMYAEWNFNLWVPAWLHILMNGAWTIFYVEGNEGAAGALVPNIARAASVALAIALTLYCRRKGYLKKQAAPA